MDSLEYWQGVTDGRLAAIESAVKEIKNSVKSIDGKVDSLRLWKAKVAGVAAVAAALVALGVQVLEAFIR